MKIRLPKIGIKKGILLTLVIAALLTTLFFLKLNNTPNEGRLKVPRSESVASSPDKYLPLATPYFSILYKDKFSLVSAQPSSENLLRYTAIPKPGGEFLQITLKKPRDNSIVLDEDYKKYQSQKNVYKLSQKFYGQEPVIIATKTAGGEINSLWLHREYILAITMQDNLPLKELDAQIKEMLDSVQWQ